MAVDAIGDIYRSQKERLFHIDFKLRFLGSITRGDLVNRFGIKAAAATRDLSLYRELAPKNVSYDTKLKCYVQTGKFKPVFDYPQSQALAALSHGLGDDYVGTLRSPVAAESPTHLNYPQLDTVAKVTQAIHRRRPLAITYCSLSSGVTRREIVPFTLVDNGLRWHVRAFDRLRDRFADFVINRIADPKLLTTADVSPNETRDADIQWNRIVEMRLVPHPKLQHPETIDQEYGMERGVLIVNVRAAVAGYVLRRWNVDCSEDHLLTGAEYHLWLSNLPTLYGVENLEIAPGYNSAEQAEYDDQPGLD